MQITRAPIAAEAFPDLPPSLAGHPLAEVISGAVAQAPYLQRLVRREADWLSGAVHAPESVTASLFVLPGAAEIEADLRAAKRRVALWVALMDLGGVWGLEEVTTTLTDFADFALKAALDHSLVREVQRGAIAEGGYVALAMGKMGAYELNYSSDIDLICLFEDSLYSTADFPTARQAYIRATKAAMKLLSEHTAEGYVFRTDLRLRPDPSVTPLCVAISAAERYYESLGRTWERAAHIKARTAAGDIAAGAAYLARLRPFVFRKHLDFAAIQDAHDIRLKLRAQQGAGEEIRGYGHNVKLGRGGIREIEFYAQTRQLIAGGRDASLRVRGTVPALEALATAGWVPGDVAARLTHNYRFLREVEHRLQMIQDAQTHSVPKSEEGLRQVAYLSGWSDPQAYLAEIIERLRETDALVSDLYATKAPAAPVRDQTEAWLRYPALRNDRARELFAQIAPKVLEGLAAAANPDEARASFETFLSRLPAGVQLFSLFAAHPALIDLIVDICATAPDLARYLGRNAQVLDAVLDGAFFSPLPSCNALEDDLTEALTSAADYETLLDKARRWQKEQHFRIGVHHLRGLISSAEAGVAYADLAAAVIRALWPKVAGQFIAKHGRIPDQAVALVGMGSLGAGALHARSDLDMIVIYDGDLSAMSDGAKPLAARAYFARLTQAFVAALSAPTAEGKLYEIDMRLRPSGRQGPVAVSLAAFESYQREEAWLWEHLALTRARVIAGAPALRDAVEGVRHAVLQRRAGQLAEISAGLADMRARLAGQPAPAHDLKRGPGYVQDIELVAQAQALSRGARVRRTQEQLKTDGALLMPNEAARLNAIYEHFTQIQRSLRLLVDPAPAYADWPAGMRQFVIGKTSVDAFAGEIVQQAREAAALIEAALHRAGAT